MDFKFVHAADLHLDSPLRNVAAEGALREVVHGATFEALRRIVDLCLRERVAFLLLAGDLYDAKDRSVRARLALRDQLARLHEAGIQTFIVHGNHDPLVASAGSVRLPASVTVFGPEWQEVQVSRAGGALCRIQGVSHAHERVTDNLALKFGRRGPEFTVGLLHANVGASPAHAAYAPCSFADLDGSGLDYWALGHVHTRQEQLLPGGGVAVYPGNPQGRHINESGPRGCSLVTVNGRTSVRTFIPVDSVRWEEVPLDIEGLSTVDEISEVLEAALPPPADGLKAQVLRVRLTGRGPLHRELQNPEALGQLREHVAELLARRRVPVLLEGWVEETRPQLDLDQLEQSGGLAAEVLSLARSSAGAPLPVAADALQSLDRALEAAGLPRLSPELPMLLAQATARALDLLVEEQ